MSANKKNDSGAAKLSLFSRPIASGKARDGFTFYSYFTFRNIVLALAAAALLVFIAMAGSPRAAMLAGALFALIGLVLIEISARRRWEGEVMGQLRRMSSDNERLARDAARNRNDTALLKKRLSDAASSVARTYEYGGKDEDIERRMLRSLVSQLSQLAEEGDEAKEKIDIVPEPEPGADLSALPQDPQRMTEAQVLHMVRAATRQDKIDVFLQPVVGLPQRKVRFYEMLARIRIRPGAYLPAAQYVEVANKQALMPIIDNLLLLRGLQIIRNNDDGDYNRAFFLNVSSATLNDPKFMGDLVEFIARNRPLAPRLIFELGQKDLSTMNPDVLPVLDGLSRLGCRFSMDQVKSLAIDFRALEQRRIRFVKMDAELLMSGVGDDAGLQRLKRLKASFDRHGIDLIVERIETERQLIELLDLDVDYGQGFLFGKPALYEGA